MNEGSWYAMNWWRTKEEARLRAKVEELTARENKKMPFTAAEYRRYEQEIATLKAKVEELEAENERLFKSTNFIVEKKQEIEEEFRGFREEAYPLVNALRERVAEPEKHIENINTVVGAAQELINGAEWDGDISTVDTGDLKALQAALQEPLLG